MNIPFPEIQKVLKILRISGQDDLNKNLKIQLKGSVIINFLNIRNDQKLLNYLQLVMEFIKFMIKRFVEKYTKEYVFLECPLTKKILQNPVRLLEDGRVYDRDPLLKFMEIYRKLPNTRIKVTKNNSKYIDVKEKKKDLEGFVDEFFEKGSQILGAVMELLKIQQNKEIVEMAEKIFFLGMKMYPDTSFVEHYSDFLRASNCVNITKKLFEIFTKTSFASNSVRDIIDSYNSVLLDFYPEIGDQELTAEKLKILKFDFLNGELIKFPVASYKPSEIESINSIFESLGMINESILLTEEWLKKFAELSFDFSTCGFKNPLLKIVANHLSKLKTQKKKSIFRIIHDGNYRQFFQTAFQINSFYISCLKVSPNEFELLQEYVTYLSTSGMDPKYVISHLKKYSDFDQTKLLSFLFQRDFENTRRINKLENELKHIHNTIDGVKTLYTSLSDMKLEISSIKKILIAGREAPDGSKEVPGVMEEAPEVEEMEGEAPKKKKVNENHFVARYPRKNKNKSKNMNMNMKNKNMKNVNVNKNMKNVNMNMNMNVNMNMKKRKKKKKEKRRYKVKKTMDEELLEEYGSYEERTYSSNGTKSETHKNSNSNGNSSNGNGNGNGNNTTSAPPLPNNNNNNEDDFFNDSNNEKISSDEKEKEKKVVEEKKEVKKEKDKVFDKYEAYERSSEDGDDGESYYDMSKKIGVSGVNGDVNNGKERGSNGSGRGRGRGSGRGRGYRGRGMRRNYGRSSGGGEYYYGEERRGEGYYGYDDGRFDYGPREVGDGRERRYGKYEIYGRKIEKFGRKNENEGYGRKNNNEGTNKNEGYTGGTNKNGGYGRKNQNGGYGRKNENGGYGRKNGVVEVKREGGGGGSGGGYDENSGYEEYSPTKLRKKRKHNKKLRVIDSAVPLDEIKSELYEDQSLEKENSEEKDRRELENFYKYD